MTLTPEPVAVISISSEPCPEDETTRCIGQGWGPFTDRLSARRFADTLPSGFLLHFIRLQDPAEHNDPKAGETP